MMRISQCDLPATGFHRGNNDEYLITHPFVSVDGSPLTRPPCAILDFEATPGIEIRENRHPQSRLASISHFVTRVLDQYS